ncbi:MAG: aminotransferase class V-fold PLP-dependent enzyme [Clostridiales Family XIII bacterium]|jgi:glycerol-3-phosphate cytidylyltransferase|nr:aminotransferase class V-fold PLP-dependent enzyme [Clostridiales Family XIII bacterium]
MKKVITYGTFDLFHEGHRRLLERAKALGDHLIVGVTSDRFDRERGKAGVRQSLLERVENVRASGLADEILVEEYVGQKQDDIVRCEVDVFAIGSDWEGVFDDLSEWCEVVYLPRTEGVSSTDLRRKLDTVDRREGSRLFTLGPVEMFPETRKILARQLPYFRTAAFSEIVIDCATRLKRLAGAPADAHVFLLTGSGTAAMEAVVAGCFDADDSLLVVDGGGFGHRFSEIAALHGIPHTAIPPDDGPPGLSGLPDAPRTALLINHHETSVGRLYDLAAYAEACRARGMFLVVDAISSFLADPLDFSALGIDAFIVSAQKALALPPGLSAVILSDRLFRRIAEKRIPPFSLYFDFTEAEKDAVRGQTPFTPAVGTILALRERLAGIEEDGGAAAQVAKTKALAEDFRARLAKLIAEGLPVAVPDHPLSNACTPLLFPRGNAADIYRRLSEEHGVWLNPNGGAEKDTMLRVGHLGDLTCDDGARLAELLASLLRESR